MNVLDVILVVLLLAALASGYRLGFVARLAIWGGMGAAIVLATFLLPAALRQWGTGGAIARLAVTLVVYGLAIAVGGSLGETIGLRLRRVIPPGIRIVDRTAGTLAGAVSVGVGIWLLAPVAAEVPGAVARQVRTSAVVDAVTSVAPPPPGPIRDLRSLVANTRFPEVFAGLRPAPEVGAPPSQLPLSEEELARVVASSVGVESLGCNALHEGSGWVVAPGTVVTNAHVVAGATELRLRLPQGGTVPATVTVFDEDRDLAVLDAPGLDAPPLALASAPPGTETAVVGYPRGQDSPRPAPASIADERTAVGRDIYGQDRVERRILVLAADLAQGDSGSPVVDPDGRVVGVTFAVAADRSATAFALDDREVRAVLDAPRGEGPGPCI